jgi:hypothetical protein
MRHLPKSNTSDLDGGEKGSGVFGVSSGNATPSFQMQKGISP